MKATLCVLVLFVTAVLEAQTSKLLVGKWEYVKTDLERSEKAGVRPSYTFKDFFLEFASDGKFRTTELHRSIAGLWSLSADEKTISGEMETGRLLAIQLIDATDQQLVIQYRNGILIMKRMSKDEPAIAPITLPAAKPVAAAAIAGRWKARQIFMEDGAEVPRGQMPNVQFQFREDGRAGAFSQGANQEGNWRLGNRNDTLLATLGNETIVFYILSATANELRLKEGPNGIVMVLARMP